MNTANKILSWMLAVATAEMLGAAPFDGVQNDVVNLSGGEASVREIEQKGWEPLDLEVSGGTFRITDNYWTHGGLTTIGPGATLAVGGRLTTGAGDAKIRTFRFGAGARLVFEDVAWEMDHTVIELPTGCEWLADVRRFVFRCGINDNRWDISGRAVFPRGLTVADAYSDGALTVTVRKGGTLGIGGPYSLKSKRGRLTTVMEGGTLALFWDAKVEPGSIRLKPGAKVTVEVGKGVEFDPSVIEVPADAKLNVVHKSRLSIPLPPRYRVKVRYDRAGRCYWLDADSGKGRIRTMTVRYPDPDVRSTEAFRQETVKDTVFRRRFPSGKGPWTVQVALVDVDGERLTTDVVVRRPAETIHPPRPNEDVLFGLCAYTQNDHFRENANDILRDIWKGDLCNLVVAWSSLRLLLPESWPEAERAEWTEKAKTSGISAMSIYAAEDSRLQKDVEELYGGRYYGDNVGEYASFIYQNRGVCQIPMDLDLAGARDAFVNRYIGKGAFGWKFPYVFSTCGAALSCYELAGGIDFICNELWAIGAQNLAHASAEARGAARKWGPEYWGGWNAHEWQTCGMPYRTDQKFDSCYVGFLQEYVFGTSMIVMECGTQGTQAWKYTAAFPGQDKSARAPDGYDGEVATRYRAACKRFYDWLKAHPRDQGTPETKIAMALGNLDGYLGMNGGFAVWSQHDNAAANPQWKYGAPEDAQGFLKDIFFPLVEKAVEPFGNSWLAGTPYGQADVMQIDDDSTLKDLARYELLVFGGWNTMTPHVKDVLERYVKNGGTLVMSRPELTTRVDRDFTGYTDKDLLPPFGFLPPEGKVGEYVEKKSGKGRYFLFTGHGFPAASAEGRQAYRALVGSLAAKVGQTVKLQGEAAELQAITYGVYPKTVYFLNVDTRKAHAFAYELNGKRTEMTLQPCEIRCVSR